MSRYPMPEGRGQRGEGGGERVAGAPAEYHHRQPSLAQPSSDDCWKPKKGVGGSRVGEGREEKRREENKKRKKG